MQCDPGLFPGLRFPSCCYMYIIVIKDIYEISLAIVLMLHFLNTVIVSPF